MGTILGGVGLALFYALIAVWPVPEAQTASAGGVRLAAAAATLGSAVRVFIFDITPSADQRLFMITGMAGALGATLHATRSFYKYVGHRDLKTSWIAMYFQLPFVGAFLAIAFYLVVRAGLVTTQAASDSASPYGFAAVAVLVGLFSEQAMTKLKRVGEAVFAEAPAGTDSIKPRIARIDPLTGPVGQSVKITGSGLRDATAVTFNGVNGVPTVLLDDRIEVLVPIGATTGRIVITTPSGKVQSDTDFNVT